MTGIQLVVVAISIAFIGVSIFLGTKVKSLDDYYVAGRNAGVFICTGTLLASFLSVGTIVGQAELVYLQGPMRWNFIWWCFAGFMVLFFGPGLYMRRQKVKTTSEFFSQRFDNSRGLKVASAVTIIIGMIAFNVSMFLGIGVVIAELFQCTTTTGILISIALTVFIALIGGQMSVIVTDTIMFVLFAITGILMFPVLANSAGGWANAILTMDEVVPGYMLTLQGGNESISPVLFFICNMGLFSFFSGTGADPRVGTRTFVAKDEKTVLRTALLGSLLGLIFIFFFQTSVGIIRAIAPDIEARTAFAYACMNLVPPLIGSVAMAGIIFAGVSTATTTLSLGAFSIASDIIRDVFKPDMEEKQVMKVSWIAILVLAAISGGLAITEPAVLFYITIFGQGLFVGTFLPTFIAACYWKGTTEKGVLAGMITGIVVYFGITLLGQAGISLPFGFHQAHYTIVATALVLFVVSKMGKPTDTSLEYYADMRGISEKAKASQVVAEFDHGDKVFVTAIVCATLVLMALLCYLFYFIPL